MPQHQQAGATRGSSALTLEAIYYPRPIPYGTGLLTTLGLVFDKVYFPGVYFPTDGYSEKELQEEIERIAGLNSSDYDTRLTLAMLRFIPHAKTLSGFCEFTGTEKHIFGGNGDVTEKFVHELFDAIHGPRRPGWTPILPQGNHKSLPGGDAFLAYPGDHHYLAGAIIEAARTGLPLVNDSAGMPVPFLDQASPADDANALVTLLAIHCTKLVLPPMTALQPAELMEFREENAANLRNFRVAMLRHAASLNDVIDGLDPAQVERKTAFFVDTHILPELEELRQAIKQPARTFGDRVGDVVQFVADIGPSYIASAPGSALATAFATHASGFLAKEIGAALSKREQLRRSHLNYLIQIERVSTKR